MSRTKLVKIGPARPKFVRRKRPKAGSNGKSSGKDSKTRKQKPTPKHAGKAFPEMLNPETMPHIRLADIQTYGKKNKFTRYSVLSYEVASYHEQLVKAGVAVRRCMLISKAAAVHRELGLTRNEVLIGDHWVIAFLKNCVRVRDAIRKNARHSRTEVCSCSCAPVAEKNSPNCFDPSSVQLKSAAPATPPPIQHTSDLTNLFSPKLTATRPRVQQTTDLSNLFLPRLTDDSKPDRTCSGFDTPASSAPSLADLFLSPVVTCNPKIDEPSEVLTSTCCACAKNSTIATEEWRSTNNRTISLSVASGRGTKRSFSSDEETLQPLRLVKRSGWFFPEPSFPELLRTSSMNKDCGYVCQPASDSDSDLCSAEADELFLMFDVNDVK